MGRSFFGGSSGVEMGQWSISQAPAAALMQVWMSDAVTRARRR